MNVTCRNNVQHRGKGCVYCGRDGPYNDEHIIPAGLGAGNSMLLRGLVCKPCNDEFSKFEVRVLRRGDIGLGRMALQTSGRERGSKTRTPTFDTTSAKLVTEDERALEISVGHRLAVEVLPQITQMGRMLEGGGSNRTKVGHFLERLEKLLQNKVTLVRKCSSSTQAYTLMELELGSTGYLLINTQLIKKADDTALWLEVPESYFPAALPRIMERSRSSIVVQIADGEVAAAAAFLSLIKANLTNLKAALSEVTQAVNIEQPQVHVTAYSPTENETARFIAKIGFNLLVDEYGETLSRHACFDSLCASVRNGKPELRMNIWDENESVVQMLRKVFNLKHWMMLAPIPNPAGHFGLALGCSFYGGVARLVLLAEEIPEGFERQHAFFVVDYQAHTVQRYSLAEVLEQARILDGVK